MTAALPVRTGAALTPEQVYARVAPSVAYVETPLGTGSAVLVKPGLLLTNDHVVWPYSAVRVVFPDGTAYDDVPVSLRDPIADLATLDVAAVGGPPRSAVPAALADGTGLPIGADLYLVGYPAEAEDEPQPALSRGLLSRVRRWEPLAVPFLQTDADIAGGQSGGALVAADGSVVGISSMFLGDSDFALAMSAPEAMARVERLLAGDAADVLAPRTIPLAGGEPRHSGHLDTPWSEAVYVLNAPYGTSVDLAVDSTADATLTVLSPYGDVDVDADERRGGGESGTVDIRDDGPYFIIVALKEPGDFTLRTSEPVVPYADPDDGTALAPGTTVQALMDFPGDIDTFRLTAPRGGTVEITVDSINISPDASLELATEDGTPPILNQHVAGPLGLTLTGTFEAEAGTTYVLSVRDADDTATGGYIVSAR
jgi:S1-C subfamily serine protease